MPRRREKQEEAASCRRARGFKLRRVKPLKDGFKAGWCCKGKERRGMVHAAGRLGRWPERRRYA